MKIKNSFSTLTELTEYLTARGWSALPSNLHLFKSAAYPARCNEAVRVGSTWEIRRYG